MTPLGTATAAGARYGWSLQVIDDVGHFAAEQPQAFAAALRTAFDCPEHGSKAGRARSAER